MLFCITIEGDWLASAASRYSSEGAGASILAHGTGCPRANLNYILTSCRFLWKGFSTLCQNRRVDGDDATSYLWDVSPHATQMGTTRLHLPRQDERPARVATLTVAAAPVTLQPPQRRSKEQLPPVDVWAVWAVEDAPETITKRGLAHSHDTAAPVLCWPPGMPIAPGRAPGR
jgi:hypothetical protein